MCAERILVQKGHLGQDRARPDRRKQAGDGDQDQDVTLPVGRRETGEQHQPLTATASKYSNVP